MRRKKVRGLWLPVVSNRDALGHPGSDRIPYQGTVTKLSTGLDDSVITTFTPLTTDAASWSGAVPTDSLDQGLGAQYGYMLRRILGHCYVAAEAKNADTWGAIIVAAGILVADQDSSTDAPAGVAQALPLVSGSSDDEAFETRTYSPWTANSVQSPWLWIRHWLIGNNNTSHAGAPQIGVGSNNFAFASSMKSGPWVDVKSRRHVKPGERLYFALSIAALEGDGTNTYAATTYVHVVTNFRMYGNLTRPRRGGVF